MIGLFSTLNLGVRSLQAQQTAVEVAGQNLANVNNTAYTRQRVQIQTSPTVQTAIGPQGTGAQAVAIEQLRDLLVEGQIRSETSVGGYWTAQQKALQYAQTGLGEFIDRNADAVGSAGSGIGALSGLADELNDLFNAFQSVATATATTSPNALTERQDLLNQAQLLATRFNQSAQRLSDLSSQLDDSLEQNVTSANQLLQDIASLNQQIMGAELGNSGVANDLRDLREQKLVALGELVNFDAVEINGGVAVSINGQSLVTGGAATDALETYYGVNSELLVRTAGGGVNLALAGGSMAGTIEVRDGALKSLRDGLDGLAASLIAEVNNVHRAGFSLTGSTGEDFFTGTSAATMGVNAVLVADPGLVQLAGIAGAAGDNAVGLALAHLGGTAWAALGNQTFAGDYGRLVGKLGEDLRGANDQVAAHGAVARMLQQQRDAVSGVSVDEEMADLVRFQRAYQASARIITTVDEMLQTVLSLKS